MDRPKNRLLTALTVSAVVITATALYSGSYLAIVVPQSTRGTASAVSLPSGCFGRLIN